MVDEKYFDATKITDDIIDAFIEERTKGGSNFSIAIALVSKLRDAGVFNIEEELDEDDLEELEEDITEHLVAEVLPNLAQKSKKTQKIPIVQVMNEVFDILTNNGKGVIPLKNGKNLTVSVLKSKDFDVNDIDVDNLELTKRNKKRFDINDASASLGSVQDIGGTEQSKFGFKNLEKVISFLTELYAKKAREDDGIYFEFVDIPLENLFSNKVMSNMSRRQASYSYWKEVKEDNDELIKKLGELVELLQGKKTIEELKADLKKTGEDKDISQLDNIIKFLETMDKINKQKVYDKGKIIFNTKFDSVRGAPSKVTFNKLNYVVDVDFSNIELEKINSRATKFIKRFLYNQGFLNKLYDVDNVKTFQEVATSADTGQDIRISEVEEEAAETFEEYDKLEEALTDEIKLDPLGIVYLERDLQGLAGIYTDYKETLLSRIRTQFRKFRKILALEPEDFDELQQKLENTVKFVNKIEDQRVHLPIFMFNEKPLKRYYKESSSLASQIEENVLDMLKAYRDLIQEEKTFSAQSIYLVMMGTQNILPERVRPQERYIQRQPTRVGSKKIRDFQGKIKTKIDEINDLMLKVYVKPMHSIHRAGFSLPFEGSVQLRTIAALSEEVGDEYLAYKIMSDNLKELDYAFIENTQIEHMIAFIKAMNEGDLFDKPNDKKLREKAQRFSRAVAKAFGKNRRLRNQINREIASMFGAVQELSSTEQRIEDFEGIDVAEAFTAERVDDPDEIGALQVLVNALKEKKSVLTAGKSGGGMIDKSRLNTLFSELDRVMKSDIYSRILQAHDSLRIIKGKPIYYAKRNENNFDHVEDMLVKMQTEHNLDMTASELVSVINEIDSFDNISKAYGISSEHVYLIKANFR